MNVIEMENVKLSQSELISLMEEPLEEFNRRLGNLNGINGLCTQLLTSSTSGLSSVDDIQKRREYFGSNTQNSIVEFIGGAAPKSVGRYIWEGCIATSILIKIPFAFALVSQFFSLITLFAVVEDYDDDDSSFASIIAFFIASVPFLTSVALNGVTNYTFEKNYLKTQLQRENEILTTVIRNEGNSESIKVTDIVVGDICVVKAGAIIPADGIRLDDDEPYSTSSNDPRLYAGATTNSDVKMIVLDVGIQTMLARCSIAKNQPNPKRKSLHSDLSTFSRVSIAVALVLGIITTLIMVCRFSVQTYLVDGEGWHVRHAQIFVRFIISGIIIFLLALPEIIPITILFFQCLELHKLKKNGLYLKNLDAHSKIAKVTNLVLDIDCLGNLELTPELILSLKKVGSAGWTIDFMLQKQNREIDTSILEVGFHENQIHSLCYKEKMNLVQSIVSSGGFVAVISNDVSIASVADLGLHTTETRWIGSQIYLQNISQNLVQLKSTQAKTYDFIYFLFQFRVVGLFVICLEVFIGAVGFDSAFLKHTNQVFLFILTFFVVCAYACKGPKARTPKKPKQKLSLEFISPQMWINMLGQALFQGTVIIVIAWNTDRYYYESWENGMMTASITWMTLFNAFNATKFHGEINVFRGIRTMYPFISTWIFFAILQVVLVQFGGLAFSTLPLDIYEWQICLAFGVGTLLVYLICNIISNLSARCIKPRT